MVNLGVVVEGSSDGGSVWIQPSRCVALCRTDSARWREDGGVLNANLMYFEYERKTREINRAHGVARHCAPSSTVKKHKRPMSKDPTHPSALRGVGRAETARYCSRDQVRVPRVSRAY